MQLLNRYVVGQICQVFLITLTALTLLLLMIGALREFVNQGLSPVHLLRLIPYLLPSALLFSIPATTLFVISLVYGRMSSANELVALKSCGINPMTVVWPAFVLAIVLSFVTVWLNDIAMSWGYSGVQRVLLSTVEDVVFGMLKTQKSYSTRRFSIVVRGVEGRTLVHPIVNFEANDDSPPITIVAEEAELRSAPNSAMLIIRFHNGTADFGGATFSFPDVFEHEIALDQAMRKADASQAPAHLPLRSIPEIVERQKGSIEKMEQQLAACAGLEMATGDFQALTAAKWTERVRTLRGHRQHLYRLETEPPRRWANGFSCLCFALIGVPMAIRLKNADILTSFFACFMPILIGYYPLLVYGVDRAKAGAVPANSVWLANAIVAACGLWLLRHLVRY